MATHDWDGNIGRLKPYLVEMEARLSVLEALVAELLADKKPSPDPQRTASDAMKAFVDVTEKPASPPADKKGASTKA